MAGEWHAWAGLGALDGPEKGAEEAKTAPNPAFLSGKPGKACGLQAGLIGHETGLEGRSHRPRLQKYVFVFSRMHSKSSRRIFLILRRVLGLCAMSRYSKYHTTPREAGESERTAENARRIVWSTFDAGRAGRPAGEAPGPGPKPVRSPLPGPEVSDRIPIQTLVREFASTNCKHVYSFLGPYINSCDVVASDRIPSPFPTGLGQLPPITAPLLAQCPSPRQVWSQAGPVPGRHEKRQYGSRRQPRSAGWPNTPPPSGPTHPRPLRHHRHRSEAGP